MNGSGNAPTDYTLFGHPIMTRNYTPYDFGIWLEHIDVNSLSDTENDEIASVNITDDAELNWLISCWIKPRYEKWDTKNKEIMRDILLESDQWSEDELRPIFDEISTPFGQDIDNIRRFIEALKNSII